MVSLGTLSTTSGCYTSFCTTRLPQVILFGKTHYYLLIFMSKWYHKIWVYIDIIILLTTIILFRETCKQP